MRTTVVIIVCSMIVLQGCYSSSPLRVENGRQPASASFDAFMVQTHDGRSINLEPNHFVEVTAPSSFVYGIGERAEKGSSRFLPFTGRFQPVSQRIEAAQNSEKGGRPLRIHRLLFTLPDSSLVRMSDVDCILVDSARGAGIWYSTLEWDPEAFTYVASVERIPQENIQSLEVKNLDALKTVSFVAGSLAIGFLVVFAIGVSSW